MLVATPGQTAPYTSNLHSGTGGGVSVSASVGNSTSGMTKKSNTTASTTTAIGAVGTCHTSMPAANNKTINNLNNNISVHKVPQRPIVGSHNINHSNRKLECAGASSRASSRAVNAASALMKTLSVRLHRGTEFIKDTVHKALVVSNASNVLSNVTTIPNSSNTTITKTTTNNIKSSITIASNYSIPSTSTNSVRAALPSASFLKLYTVPPTALHRSIEARSNAGSTDSLLKEMCHFKPIRPSPITPVKCGSKSRGCSLKFPKSKMATRLNINVNCDESHLGGTKAKQITQSENKPKPSSPINTPPPPPPRESAFVCLIAHVNLDSLLTSAADNQDATKSKPKRARTKATSTATTMPAETATAAVKPKAARRGRKPQRKRTTKAKKQNNATTTTTTSETLIADDSGAAVGASPQRTAPTKQAKTLQHNKRKRKLNDQEIPVVRKSTRITKDCKTAAETKTDNYTTQKSQNDTAKLKSTNGGGQRRQQQTGKQSKLQWIELSMRPPPKRQRNMKNVFESQRSTPPMTRQRVRQNAQPKCAIATNN